MPLKRSVSECGQQTAKGNPKGKPLAQEGVFSESVTEA